MHTPVRPCGRSSTAARPQPLHRAIVPWRYAMARTVLPVSSDSPRWQTTQFSASRARCTVSVMERTCRSRAGRPAENASRREIVERVEAYVRTHCEGPVPLSRLCRIVGLSERGLRNAFYSIRGTSPTRCILAQRLRSVRQTLSDASTNATTVTAVATHYGFYELGRFAGCYKTAFGEAPSDTLRRRRRALRHTNTKRSR